MTDTLKGFKKDRQYQEKLESELKKLNPEQRLFFLTLIYNLNDELTRTKLKNEQLVQKLKTNRDNKRIQNLKNTPISRKGYDELIKEASGPSYQRARLRVGIALLTVTGLPITEMLKLKIGQIQKLINNGYINIPRKKRGTANGKAFLSKEGSDFLKKRMVDFDIISKNKSKSDCLMTSQKSPSPNLTRETFTREINRIMSVVSDKAPFESHYTSHSLRRGFILQLWRDEKDIEFVKHELRHKNIPSESQ